MTRTIPEFNDALPASDWRSFAVSAGFHLLLFVGLGLLWTSRTIGGGSGEESPRAVEIVLAPLDDSTDYLEPAEMQPPAEAGGEAGETETQLPTSDKPPVDTSELLSSPAPVDVPLPGFSSTDFARSSQQSGPPRDTELSPEQLALIAAEQAAFESRRPKGPPTTLRVFGSGDLTGRKFVFVIDRSRSMGSEGLGVLHAAAGELEQAIGTLEAYHQFQIVAYHHENVFIGHRGLLDATPATKGLVAEFIHNLASFGGTEHEPALATALGMNPDVVVLMSDGGLPELNESQLRRIHQSARGIQIHCLQFGQGPQQDPDTFMRTLALQNSGTYRYIDVNEWNQQK